MMLTTRDILDIMSDKRSFGGVYAINRLPLPLMRSPCGVIINLDYSWNPGTHWVSVFMPKHGPAFYFDPFGGYPPDQVIVFMERNSRYGWKYNEKKVQGDLSLLCGFYCIEFLRSCPNYNRFFRKFVHCGKRNDVRLRQLMRK